MSSNRVGWKFDLWDDERPLVVSQVDGRILKKAKMSLAMSLRTGNSHEVSGQFADNHLDLFMGGFAKDMCENKIKHFLLGVQGVCTTTITTNTE